jgi:acetylornithine deacetylase/succinyl-diaminopimelate desuccinylase-like protein
MTDPLEHILRLASDIGPRPSGGEGERKAAEYIRGRLEESGFSVKVEDFRVAPSPSLYMVPIFLLTLAGVVVAIVLDRAALGLLLSGFALVAFLGEVTLALRLVAPAVSVRRSRNVVARLAPKELPRRRLVLAAHYDSPKPDLGWTPGLLRFRRPAFLLLVVSMVLLPFMIAVSAAAAIPVVAYAAVPFAVVIGAALLLMLVRDFAYHHVPGANVNASGVAVMLTLCEALAVDQPVDTEVVALATGSLDVGAAGMQAFLKRHGDELERAWVLSLDGVGAGDVFFTTAEGLLLKHRTSEELREVAEKVAARPDVQVSGRAHRLATSDAEPILLRRLEAITVMAGKDGVPVNSHQPADTIDAIDPDTIDTAYRFVEAMVRRLIA